MKTVSGNGKKRKMLGESVSTKMPVNAKWKQLKTLPVPITRTYHLFPSSLDKKYLRESPLSDSEEEFVLQFMNIYIYIYPWSISHITSRPLSFRKMLSWQPAFQFWNFHNDVKIFYDYIIFVNPGSNFKVERVSATKFKFEVLLIDAESDLKN